MKISPVARAAATPTLQNVLDRLAGDRALAVSRKRDLRSAVTSFAKLAEPAAGGNPARPRRHPPDPRQHGAGPGQGLAQALGEPAQRPCRRHRCLGPAADAQDRRVDPRRAPGPDFLHAADRAVRAWPFAFRPMGELAPDPPRRPSTTARSSASLPNWMGRPWSGTFRNLRRTVARAWNALVARHQAAGLRPVTVPANRPCADRNSLAAASSLVPRGCRALSRLGAVPDPLAEGARARALAPQYAAPAANSDPFGRERRGCGRDPGWSTHLSGEPRRARYVPGPPASSMARRTDARCPSTPTGSPTR